MPSLATWKKLQAMSGLAFAGYLVMHFACHYSLSFGWDLAHDMVLQMRVIYQHPAFEAGLAVATLVHMTSNTVIIMKRGKIQSNKKKEGGKEPAGTHELNFHRYAGYVLGFAIFGHVGATRIGPLFIMEDPSEYDYSFLTYVNGIVPMNLFPVYLIVFGVAGVWHTIYGTRSALATLSGGSVVGKPFPFILKPFAILNYFLIISAVLATTGYYYYIDTDAKSDIIIHLNDALGIH